MSQGQKAPEKGSKLVVCGIVGNRDFNYAEMLRLEQALKTLELRARLAVFDGDHRWPAAEFCSAALRYMELVSLLDGGKAGEKATAEILALEKADAEKLLGQKGQFLRGYGRLEELARLLKGAEAQKTFTDKIAAVEAEPRYKQEKEAQAEFNRLSAECAKIADADERFTKTVESIQKFAADRAGTDTAELAVAQLRSLGLQMVMAGAQLFQAGRFAESGALLKRARLLAPKDAVLAYSLACAQARAGQKDDALKTIAEAVELGFKDGKRLSEDANLESLRGIDEFRKLVEKLGGPPPKEKKENFL